MKFPVTVALALFAAVVAFLSHSADAATIYPQPSKVKYDEKTTYSMRREQFKFDVASGSSEILESAFRRYTNIIFGDAKSVQQRLSGLRAPMLANPFAHTGCNSNATVTRLVVTVSSTSEVLQPEQDESYMLETDKPSIAYLTAPTVWGALRGLESFAQLAVRSLEGAVTLHSAVVSDSPRFQYRGFMIDTSRHFYPLRVLYQHIDAMSYAKFNVLHWHIVDDTSFPYESSTFPEMAQQGAFSPRHTYSHKDIADVQRYARFRGIRVIPEFDVPGHVTNGYLALKPQIVTTCYDVPRYPTGPLNPTINATYEFLDKFYDELKTVWDDKYFHIGGDEVVKRCWMSNPQIKQWMTEHPEIADYHELQNYFTRKLLAMLKQKELQYICWQEVFDSGADLLPDTLVEVWIPEKWQETMERVTAKGYKTVLAGPYYLNLISYGLDWHNYWRAEPTNYTGGVEAEKHGLIAGVEVAMWSEYVDATNFVARSWPRAAAVGERGWSPKNVTDIEDASRRLHEFRCKLLKRNINAQPITNGANQTSPVLFKHHCEEEWEPHYDPVF